MKARSLLPCRSGFTLIEIIIVLFIIGIATALTGIMISGGSGGLEVRTFSKDIANVLKYARSHAVSGKKVYCFVIDQEKHSYTLYAEDINYKNKEELIKKDIPEELEMVIQDSDADSQYIEFFPYGNSSGGVVEIANPKGVTYFITINRITGKLDVEKAE